MKPATDTGSGQSSYPNQLDSVLGYLFGKAGSGQSSYPNQLDFDLRYLDA